MIVPLVKITLCGLYEEKESLLAELQELGCLHLIALAPAGEAAQDAGRAPAAREALRFLLECPNPRRRQARDTTQLDAAEVESRALHLKRRLQELGDERDFLRCRIAELEPWGEFAFPPPGELGPLRFWFYKVPPHQMGKIAALDLIWQEVRRDHQYAYVVVLAETEPQGMPVARTPAGAEPLSALERRLDEVETEIEDLQAERSALTRWCTLFARNLYRLADRAALAQASITTLDQGPLFALQAWAPRDRAPALRDLARTRGLVLDVADPTPGETPPTLMTNRPKVASGQDLVSFYMIPNYWLWDPSGVVFFSFAVFFAMIMADAGYGAILAVALALGWRRMGAAPAGLRFRPLCLAMVSGTVLFGVLIGSYFGAAPRDGSFLSSVAIVNMNDYGAMMKLSILIGAAHLVLANGIEAWRRRGGPEALAPVGWILLYLGALTLALGSSTGAPGLAGKAALGAGFLSIILFTRPRAGWGKRLLGGFGGLTRLSGAFGDTLSYLRLFALGLASGCLAVAFNDLARGVREAVPGFGLLFALLILILGHGLNFALGISSGFIHGLRLNFIEFFNWSLGEEGIPFRRFEQKEKTTWNR